MSNASEHTPPKKLSYSRYTIVNIRQDERLIPHLCVIVNDDAAFAEAASDPHHEFIITDTLPPVRKGVYMPVILTPAHTVPVSDESELTILPPSDSTFSLSDFVAETGINGEPILTEEMLEMLAEQMGNVLDNRSAAEKNLTSELEDILTPDTFDPNVEPPEVDEEENVDYAELYENIKTQIDAATDLGRLDLNIYRTTECVTGEWMVELPVAFMTLANVLNDASEGNIPAILISSTDTFKTEKAAQGYDYRDFAAVVLYEDYESDEHSNSVAEVVRVMEGSYMVPVNDADISRATHILFDVIVRLAAGDVTVMTTVNELMNNFSRLSKSDAEEGTELPKPKAEDSIYHSLINVLIDLYEGTSTENTFDVMYDNGLLEGYEDSLDDLAEQTEVLEGLAEIQTLFETDEMSALFAKMNQSLTAPVIPPNAKEADLATFYSTPVREGTFPESMSHLPAFADFSFVYENNVMDDSALLDVVITADNAADIFFGMLIAVAVRLKRLQDIKDYGLHMIATNMILKIVQEEYNLRGIVESLVNEAIETVPDNGTMLLAEMSNAVTPDEQEARRIAVTRMFPGSNVPLVATFPVTYILHKVNHAIVDREIDPLLIAKNLPAEHPMIEYAEQMTETLAEYEDDNPLGKDACPETAYAIHEIVSSDADAAGITEAVLTFMTVAAATCAEQYSGGAQPGSERWNECIEAFYITVREVSV